MGLFLFGKVIANQHQKKNQIYALTILYPGHIQPVFPKIVLSVLNDKNPAQTKCILTTTVCNILSKILELHILAAD